MTRRRALTAALITGLLLGTLALAVQAQSPGYQRGLAALERGEPRTAYGLWRALADQGDPHAQFGIGLFFYDGVFVERSYTEANYWFLLAAEQGLAPAQYNLGNAYKKGLGVPRDDKRAVYWWRRAARQGFAPAQFNLGTAMIHGKGVESDHRSAMTLYERAAKTGNTMAQQMLEQYRDEQSPAPAEATAPAAGGCTAWLDRAGAGFTLQLMTLSERASLATFRKSYPDVDIRVCPYLHAGQTWYRLLHGTFANREEARRAFARLPAPLRRHDPYIRRLETLRSDSAG